MPYINESQQKPHKLFISNFTRMIHLDIECHGGKIDNYRFEVNVQRKPSTLGINNGKISKLCIWDSTKGMGNGCIVDYDNDWLIKPLKEFEPYIRKIMKLYNWSKIRFKSKKPLKQAAFLKLSKNIAFDSSKKLHKYVTKRMLRRLKNE